MPSPDPAIDRFTLTVKTGDYVFREGDPGAELFLVEEGRVELSMSAAPNHSSPRIGATPCKPGTLRPDSRRP